MSSDTNQWNTTRLIGIVNPNSSLDLKKMRHQWLKYIQAQEIVLATHIDIVQHMETHPRPGGKLATRTLRSELTRHRK